MRSRCSARDAAASGPPPGSTSTRSQSSSGTASVPSARPRDDRCRARSVATLMTMRNNHVRSEEHTSELQSRFDLVCRLLLEKKKKPNKKLHILKLDKNPPTLDDVQL